MAYVRSFLKWPGNKHRVLSKLLPLFPPGKRFIEPFVGSGVVFANTNYEQYLIGDINNDLASIYSMLWYLSSGLGRNSYLKKLKKLFSDNTNNKECYYKIREQFNNGKYCVYGGEHYDQASTFIYLNRHGFNGLCRYNKDGKFNVPFGEYKTVRFPEDEIIFFTEKLNRRGYWQSCFKECLCNARKDDVIYCDPPFCPISKIGFTNYSGSGFTFEQHKQLVQCAITARDIGAVTLISNHDLDITRELYKDASKIVSFPVRRCISANVDSRGDVQELVAIY